MIFENTRPTAEYFSEMEKVLDSADIISLRSDICKRYPNQKVIVAPCRCKHYISRRALVIDNDGKISPDWFHFATGVVSLIYDLRLQNLMLALFDVGATARMLWMLKVKSFTKVTAPNSSFHVLNTTDDCSEHVGLLYENREVAALMLKTFSLLANIGDPLNSKTGAINSTLDTTVLLAKRNGFPQSIQRTESSKATVESSPSRKGKLFRSFSFSSRNKSNSDSPSRNSCSLPRSQSNRITQSNYEDPSTSKVSNTDASKYIDKELRKKDRKFKKFGKRSKTFAGLEGFPDMSKQQQHPKRNSALGLIGVTDSIEEESSFGVTGSTEEESSLNETDLSLLNRFNSDISAIEAVRDSNAISGLCAKDKSHLRSPTDKSSPKSEKKSSLFKRVKLKRSLSERLPKRSYFRWSGDKNNVSKDEERPTNAPAGPANTPAGPSRVITSDVAENNNIVSDNQNSLKKKEKQTGRYTKPRAARAASDSLLLKGDYIKCAVDTGLMARYLRERKLWVRTLESGNVMTTDLCVTEL